MTTESPALKVIENFEKEGSEVIYFDSYIPRCKHKTREYEGIREFSAKVIECADLVVITTMHTNINYDFIQQHAKFIFDTKNAMKHVKNRDDVELL